MAPIVDGLDYPGRVDIPAGDVRAQGLIYWPGIGDHRRVFFYSGICLLNLKGTGSNWNRAEATIHLPVGAGVQWQPPGGTETPQTPLLLNSATTVTLAAVSNDNVANNAGWAADWARAEVADQTLKVVAGIAVNDIDGHIWRLAYQVHALGLVG
jgi:hypothetical protein